MTLWLLREIKGRCYVVTKSRNPTLCEREQEIKEFRIERNVDLRDRVTSLSLIMPVLCVPLRKRWAGVVGLECWE